MNSEESKNQQQSEAPLRVFKTVDEWLGIEPSNSPIGNTVVGLTGEDIRNHIRRRAKPRWTPWYKRLWYKLRGLAA